MRIKSQSAAETPSTMWKNSLNLLPLLLGASVSGRSLMQNSPDSLMLWMRDPWYLMYVIFAVMIACSMVCKARIAEGTEGRAVYVSMSKNLRKRKPGGVYKHGHVCKHVWASVHFKYDYVFHNNCALALLPRSGLSLHSLQSVGTVPLKLGPVHSP